MEKTAARISEAAPDKETLKAFFLTFFWLFCAILVDPVGEFPLNDDWAYSKPVYYLLEQHDLKLLNWPSMTLIAHVLWGWLVGAIFGFSHTALRLSVIFLGAVGLLAFYFLLLGHHGKNRSWKLFCIFVVTANPLFFSLSCSFMTETPFFAFMLLACHGYVRFTLTGKNRYLVSAVVFTAVIVLIRQTGLFVPLAYALCRVFVERRARLSYFMPVIVAAIVLIGYNWFLVATDNTYASMGKITDLFAIFAEPVTVLDRFWVRTSQAILLMALFLLPLVAIYLAGVWGGLSKKEKKKRFVVVAAFLVFLIRGFGEIPLGNIIYDIGVGPKTLSDYFVFRLNDHTGMGNFALNCLRCLAFLSGAALVFSCADRVFKLLETSGKTAMEKSVEWFPVFAVILYFPFLILFEAFFDRYLLPLIPFFALFLLVDRKEVHRKAPKPVMSFACVFTIFMLLFSMAATKDYLNFNRTRWRAIDFLTQRGTAHEDIDCGFEYSGWHVSENDNYLWGQASEYDYRIAFGAMDGYSPTVAFSYRRLLPFQEEKIYVLKKRDDPEWITLKDPGKSAPDEVPTALSMKKGG